MDAEFGRVEIVKIDRGIQVLICHDYLEYSFHRVGDEEKRIPIEHIKKIVFHKHDYNSANAGCNMFLNMFGMFTANNLTDSGGVSVGIEQDFTIPGRLIIKYSNSMDEKDKWDSYEIRWSKLYKRQAELIINAVKSYKPDIITKFY